VRGREAIGTIVGCIARAVVECNVIDIKSCTVADTEAVYGVVLDVDVVDCAGSKN
jgi:exosome complex RNA-binding protein Rrp42 (RNase PH superfamily)